MRMQRVPRTSAPFYTVDEFRADQARNAFPLDLTGTSRAASGDPAFAWRDFAPGCGTLELAEGHLPAGMKLGLELLHCRGRTLAMWRLDGGEVGFFLVRVGEA
jgi:hypothetical protein